MTDIYTARATNAEQVHIKMAKVDVPKNGADQYGHDVALIGIKELKAVLGKLWTDGLSLTALLDEKPNSVNRIRSTDVVTIESVLTASKKEAEANKTTPNIATRSDARDEAERINIHNQSVIGAKEGATEAITALFGSDVTDTVLRASDGREKKGIDEYELYEIVEAALAGADRPATMNVLDQVVEVLGFQFNWRRKVAPSVEQLRAEALKLESFGVAISEAHIALIILANVEMAAPEEYGREFRVTLQAIRRQYKYNYVHDAASIAWMLKELAEADEVRDLKAAPAPNTISSSRGTANAVAEQVSILKNLMQEADDSGFESAYESAYSAAASSSSSSSSESSGEGRRAAAARREKEKAKKKKKKIRSRSSSRPSGTDGGRSDGGRSGRKQYPNNPCPHCKIFGRRRPHDKIPEARCFWNKKFKGYRLKWVCDEMEVPYVPRHKFSAAMGGHPDVSDDDE